MFEKVKALLVEELNVDEAKITLEAELTNDLGVNSLELADLILQCEEKFGIEIDDEDLQRFITVGDVVTYLDAKAEYFRHNRKQKRIPCDTHGILFCIFVICCSLKRHDEHALGALGNQGLFLNIGIAGEEEGARLILGREAIGRDKEIKAPIALQGGKGVAGGTVQVGTARAAIYQKDRLAAGAGGGHDKAHLLGDGVLTEGLWQNGIYFHRHLTLHAL